MRHGASAAQAKQQAIGLIGQMIERQATILSYIDVFWVCAIVAGITIPAVLFLVARVRLGNRPVVSH